VDCMNRKKKAQIISFIIVILFSFQGLTTFVTADKIVGDFLSDGSFMIVYEPGIEGSLDIKNAISPQGDYIQSDSFRVFIGGGTQAYSASLYVEVHYFNGTYRFDNNTFKYAIDPILVKKGVNPDGHPYYFDTKIDLQLAPEYELVVFRYLEIVKLFRHKTSEFLVPVLSNAGFIILSLVSVFTVGILVTFFAFLVAVMAWKKYFWIPRIPWWLITTIVLIALTGFLAFLMLDLNFNFELAAVSLIKNLGLWLALPLFVFLVSVFGNYMSVHSNLVKKALIFVLKYDPKSQSIKKLIKLDDVIEKDGELFHVHTENDLKSLKEFLLAVFDYRHYYQDYESLDLPDMENEESDIEKLILATDYHTEPGEFMKISDKGKKLYAVPLVGALIIFLGYAFNYIISLGQLLGFVLSIGMTIFIVGLILVIIDTKINSAPPKTILDPIVDEEILELLLKIDIVKQLKKRIRQLRASLMVSDLNTDLESLIDIEAVISGKNPDEILRFLTNAEDLAGDAELLYYDEDNQPFSADDYVEKPTEKAPQKDKKLSKEVGKKEKRRK